MAQKSVKSKVFQAALSKQAALFKKLKDSCSGIIDGSSQILTLHDFVKTVVMDLSKETDTQKLAGRLLVLYDCYVSKQTDELEKLFGFTNDVFDAIRALERIDPAQVLVQCQERLPDSISSCGISSPKFWFGQQVKFSWVNDDARDHERFGQTLWYVCRVTGVVFKHPDYKPCFALGWVYYVEIIETHLSLTDEVGLVELFHEAQLVPWS